MWKLSEHFEQLTMLIVFLFFVFIPTKLLSSEPTKLKESKKFKNMIKPPLVWLIYLTW